MANLGHWSNKKHVLIAIDMFNADVPKKGTVQHGTTISNLKFINFKNWII